MSRQRRVRYSDEFKANAIAMVESQGYSCMEAARRLGINRNMLDRWRRKANRPEAENESAAPASDERDKELQRLREENRKLREEKEILKKATAFFVSESD